MELTDICTQLKRTRLKKNISLQDVSKQTKLHPSMLHNIEEVSDLDNVGKFYLKGFLKIYAHFLGQDSLLKDIDEAFTREKQKKHKSPFSKEQPEPQKPPQEKTQEKPPAPEPKKTRQISFPKIRLDKKALYVAIAIIALITVARLAGRKKTDTPEPQIQQTESAFTAPKTIKQQGNARPLASILTKGDVLVEVRADNKLIFQNIIIKGTKESWMADEKLEVKISNPSLVSLEIDNHIIPTSNTKRPALYVVTSEGFRVEK